MEFKSYSSIENVYRDKFTNGIRERGYNQGQWVVTSKIHGANLSIWFDGSEFKIAKRSDFFASGKKVDDTHYFVEGSDFYNYQEALQVDSVLHKVDTIFQIFKNSTDVTQIAVYGELFGGSYPHPDVKRCDVKAVQKGVFYCPEQRFYCFDIRVNEHYISYTDMELACQQAGLLYAEPLFLGTFDECLAYPNDGPSTIHKRFDLPDLPDNIMEGVVIKPVNVMYFPNGERVILKNKNEKFAEKAKGPREHVERVQKEFSPQQQEYFDNLLEYFTEARLRGVISKIGTITEKDFGKLMGMFVKDAVEDFVKDCPNFNLLETADRSMVTKAANKAAAEFIRPNFLNIMDATF